MSYWIQGLGCVGAFCKPQIISKWETGNEIFRIWSVFLQGKRLNNSKGKLNLIQVDRK